MIRALIEEIDGFWIALVLILAAALVFATPLAELWVGHEVPREWVLQAFALLSRILMQW